MEVTFKFHVHDRIITPFGQEGIVSTCAYTRGGKRYYVDLPEARGDWFDEELLKKPDPAGTLMEAEPAA